MYLPCRSSSTDPWRCLSVWPRHSRASHYWAELLAQHQCWPWSTAPHSALAVPVELPGMVTPSRALWPALCHPCWAVVPSHCLLQPHFMSPL